MAYVTATFLFGLTRETLGLSEDATDEELRAAAEEHMIHDFCYSGKKPNDIKVEVM